MLQALQIYRSHQPHWLFHKWPQLQSIEASEMTLTIQAQQHMADPISNVDFV